MQAPRLGQPPHRSLESTPSEITEKRGMVRKLASALDAIQGVYSASPRFLMWLDHTGNYTSPVFKDVSGQGIEWIISLINNRLDVLGKTALRIEPTESYLDHAFDVCRIDYLPLPTSHNASEIIWKLWSKGFYCEKSGSVFILKRVGVEGDLLRRDSFTAFFSAMVESQILTTKERAILEKEENKPALYTFFQYISRSANGQIPALISAMPAIYNALKETGKSIMEESMLLASTQTPNLESAGFVEGESLIEVVSTFCTAENITFYHSDNRFVIVNFNTKRSVEVTPNNLLTGNFLVNALKELCPDTYLVLIRGLLESVRKSDPTLPVKLVPRRLLLAIVLYARNAYLNAKPPFSNETAEHFYLALQGLFYVRSERSGFVFERNGAEKRFKRSELPKSDKAPISTVNGKKLQPSHPELIARIHKAVDTPNPANASVEDIDRASSNEQLRRLHTELWARLNASQVSIIQHGGRIIIARHKNQTYSSYDVTLTSATSLKGIVETLTFAGCFASDKKWFFALQELFLASGLQDLDDRDYLSFFRRVILDIARTTSDLATIPESNSISVKISYWLQHAQGNPWAWGNSIDEATQAEIFESLAKQEYLQQLNGRYLQDARNARQAEIDARDQAALRDREALEALQAKRRQAIEAGGVKSEGLSVSLDTFNKDCATLIEFMASPSFATAHFFNNHGYNPPTAEIIANRIYSSIYSSRVPAGIEIPNFEATPQIVGVDDRESKTNTLAYLTSISAELLRRKQINALFESKGGIKKGVKSELRPVVELATLPQRSEKYESFEAFDQTRDLLTKYNLTVRILPDGRLCVTRLVPKDSSSPNPYLPLFIPAHYLAYSAFLRLIARHFSIDEFAESLVVNPGLPYIAKNILSLAKTSFIVSSAYDLDPAFVAYDILSRGIQIKPELRGNQLKIFELKNPKPTVWDLWQYLDSQYPGFTKSFKDSSNYKSKDDWVRDLMTSLSTYSNVTKPLSDYQFRDVETPVWRMSYSTEVRLVEPAVEFTTQEVKLAATNLALVFVRSLVSVVNENNQLICVKHPTCERLQLDLPVTVQDSLRVFAKIMEFFNGLDGNQTINDLLSAVANITATDYQKQALLSQAFRSIWLEISDIPTLHTYPCEMMFRIAALGHYSGRLSENPYFTLAGKRYEYPLVKDGKPDWRNYNELSPRKYDNIRGWRIEKHPYINLKGILESAYYDALLKAFPSG